MNETRLTQNLPGSKKSRNSERQEPKPSQEDLKRRNEEPKPRVFQLSGGVLYVYQGSIPYYPVVPTVVATTSCCDMTCFEALGGCP